MVGKQKDGYQLSTISKKHREPPRPPEARGTSRRGRHARTEGGVRVDDDTREVDECHVFLGGTFGVTATGWPCRQRQHPSSSGIVVVGVVGGVGGGGGDRRLAVKE